MRFKSVICYIKILVHYFKTVLSLKIWTLCYITAISNIFGKDSDKLSLKNTLSLCYVTCYSTLYKYMSFMLSFSVCLTVCDLMYYSPTSSSVHGILQARILE